MKKMKKTVLAGTAFAVGAASVLSMTGCCLPQSLLELLPHGREEATIQEETTSDFQVEEEVQPPVYGPPEDDTFKYEPEEEILPAVYGPPEWFD